MHPILAVLLTGLLVTAAYSAGHNVSSPSALVAATPAATSITDFSTKEAPRSLNEQVSAQIANSQCPKAQQGQVYREDRPYNQAYKEGGKIYQNLYGKPCEGPLIKAFCKSENFCSGEIKGTTCTIDGKQQTCTLPKVQVASTDGFPQQQLPQYSQGQVPPVSQTNPQVQTPAASQGIKDAYGVPPPINNTVSSANPSVQPTVNAKLQELSASPQPATLQQAQQIPSGGAVNPNRAALASQTQIAPPVNQPAANTPTKLATAPVNNPPTAQNTFQNPTTKLATAQTPQSTVTGAGANPGGSSGIKTGSGATPGSGASGSGTPAPASKPNLSTSIRNAFQGGLNATQIVNGVVNLVSTVISGGGRSSSQSVAQSVDNGARAANPRASERVATPIAVENGANPQAFAPGQNRATSAPISSFILPENVPAVVRSSADIASIFSFADNPIPYSDTPNEQQSVPGMNPTSPADIVAALNAPDAQIPGAGSNIPTVRATGTVTTLRGSQQQFVLNPNLAPENQIVAQNSFAPLPQPERSRSVVEVFHAVSIPNILETISRGSVDFILRLLKRDSPENTVVYTEREKDPVLPVSPGAAPLLPDSARADNTTINGQVAQPASQQGAPARNIERIAYEERLRETPVAIFADASAAHRGGTHVPMINRAFVFDSLLPVPQVNIDIEERGAEPGPVGTVLRVLFPWFFGEMR